MTETYPRPPANPAAPEVIIPPRIACGAGTESLVPVRIHATFERNIPALNGDVIQIKILPTAEMTQMEQVVAAKGSAGTLAYRISGSAIAKPEQEDKPRSFDFDGSAWISPAPGIAHTWR